MFHLIALIEGILLSVGSLHCPCVLPFGAYRISFKDHLPQATQCAEVLRRRRKGETMQVSELRNSALHCNSPGERGRAVQIFPSACVKDGASLWHYLPRCPRWHSVLLMENHSSGPGIVRVVHHDGSWRKRAQTA